MYKIMIGDDEGIVIEALTFIINRHFGDSCIIESAKTGRSIIELAESFRPDIAFMDIQMPGINGIEAMREIKKNNPNIIFIIVSAYDKFDYVKEALNIGALDYLNKPIEQKVIVEILQKAMEKVDTERNKRSRDLQIREKLEIVVPIIESSLIYSMLFQENYAEDTENFKRLLGIVEENGYIMVIECGDALEGGRLTNGLGVSVRVGSYYKELRDIVKEHFYCVVGSMMANKIIVMVPCSGASTNAEEEYQERIVVIESARKMVRKLRSRLDAQFKVGIGSVQKLDEMEKSYIEAMNSIRLSAGSVAHVKDLPIGCDYEEDYPIETEKALFEKTEKGDINGALAEANRFFEWMTESYPDSIMDIKMKVLEFALWAEHISYESGGRTYYFKSRHDYLQTITDMNSFDELKVWFLNKIQEACRSVATKKKDSSSGIVFRAKEYIRTHYRKDISLDDVGREVNISPYYLSKLFKEETGKNFIEYVTGIRMERAKELLERTEKSMKEICLEVGYTDPNYFSRTFKKNVGVTPTEYKEGRR